MAKSKTIFVCQSCGAQSPKWVGKCASCGTWNTYAEELQQPKVRGGSLAPSAAHLPKPIHEWQATPESRISSGLQEFDRVLGGGFLAGSLVLLGGEPGIGKSTLSLQAALSMAGRKVLYVSGEESGPQISSRANRLSHRNPDCQLLTETQVESILRHTDALRPDLLIVDSVQTLHTELLDAAPGSVSQIRETTAQIMRFAKRSGVPVLLIGHITKDGTIAGPKVLEHMVDVVLQFEGDRHHVFRIVRAQKNRFGSTSEMGIFEMQGQGLKEVSNPSALLLGNRDQRLSGTVTAITLDGARPLLLETQALVSSAVYGTPQRSATGFDLRRLHMLLAVLEKRCGFPLASKDVFLNLTGGIRIDDPAMDLAVVAAIMSSGADVPVSSRVAFAAEVGLTGEIRSVSRIEPRLREAEKLGFEQVFVAHDQLQGLDLKGFKIQISGLKRIGHLEQALIK